MSLTCCLVELFKDNPYPTLLRESFNSSLPNSDINPVARFISRFKPARCSALAIHKMIFFKIRRISGIYNPRQIKGTRVYCKMESKLCVRISKSNFSLKFIYTRDILQCQSKFPREPLLPNKYRKLSSNREAN